MPVSQFCTEAFASYARLTDADVIFGSQVRNLQFFRLFFQNNVFLYAMLVIAFLALVYFVRCSLGCVCGSQTLTVCLVRSGDDTSHALSDLLSVCRVRSCERKRHEVEGGVGAQAAARDEAHGTGVRLGSGCAHLLQLRN